MHRVLVPFEERFANGVPASKMVEVIRHSEVKLRDVNHCVKCNNPLQISTKTSTILCRTCHSSFTFLYSKGETREPKAAAYDRVPLFRKYLDNFSASVSDPPKDVLVQIYEQVSKNHMSHCIRPSFVASALKVLNLQHYNNIVLRITKRIMQVPVPILSEALIERLLLRFNAIVQTFNSIRSCALRKKILNFEYLCSKFLLMEYRSDLAEQFNLLKTRNILSSADKKLQDCCESMVDAGSTLNWSFTASI